MAEMLPAQWLLNYAIDPALRAIEVSGLCYFTPAARQLVLGTAAKEGDGFKAIHQYVGPARSVFQIEPRTFSDLLAYVTARPKLLQAFASLAQTSATVDWSTEYQFNHTLAAAFCRVYYWRVPAALPAFGDLAGMAQYWKKYYNTDAGKGKPSQWITAYTYNCQGVAF